MRIFDFVSRAPLCYYPAGFNIYFYFSRITSQTIQRLLLLPHRLCATYVQMIMVLLTAIVAAIFVVDIE